MFSCEGCWGFGVNAGTLPVKYGCGFEVNGSKREAERSVNNLEKAEGFGLMADGDMTK